MSFFSSLKGMDEKFSWSFVGFLLAIFFGGVSIYLGFVKDNKPNVQVIVTSDSNVLDIKEELGSLDVFYEGESLSKSKKDLRIITFKVVNSGDAAVLSNYYDPEDPIRVVVNDGVLADSPSVLRATSDYLLDKNLVLKSNEGEIIFNSIILEPGEGFDVRVLILHEAGVRPSISVFGKIANVSKIRVVESLEAAGEKSFLAVAFSGNYLYQVVRLFVYGFLLFFSVAIAVFVLVYISDLLEKRKKKALVANFKDFDSARISESDNYFFDTYLREGIEGLTKIHALVSSDRKLNTVNRWMANVEESKDQFRFHNERFIMEKLKIFGVITEADGVVVVDQERLALLADFIAYLNRKGERSVVKVRHSVRGDGMRIVHEDTHIG